jgi:TRAP-type uncharacterized transport system substrate-binding protein
VVTDDARPGALDVATTIASAIVARWPETKAAPAAARSPAEVVKLLRSAQLQIALLPAAEASEALEGRGRFAQDGRLPLRAVAVVGGDVLVVLESFDRERARSIAQALVESPAAGPLAKKASLRGPSAIPFHPGALDYYEGKTPLKGG